MNSLNAIHIAGTKGKGSTAAFVSSILNQFRTAVDIPNAPQKIGLYTSPHLRFVRERIQINGAPLTEEQFARYFFETWDKLEQSATEAGEDPKAATAKPVYFRFLTLMAFHTFKAERVDAAIIECGIGGAYDSTNIITSPATTAITSLGIDHVGVLGSTLPEIAWHKAGIMKTSARCFTPASQDPAAKAVLEEVAQKVPTTLSYITIPPPIANNTTKLGLQADFQKDNAALAVAIATDYLSQRSILINTTESRSLITAGLAATRWAGRCDTRHEGSITWCIDGGHTLESIQLAGTWFASQLQQITASSPPGTSVKTYLIFNQQTRERAASGLVRALHATLSRLLERANSDEAVQETSPKSPFTTAIFTPNTTFSTNSTAAARTAPDLISVGTNTDDISSLAVQHDLAATWSELDPSANVVVRGSIEEGVNVVRSDGDDDASADSGQDVRKVVLVTGSLHLVGGVLEILEGGGGAS